MEQGNGVVMVGMVQSNGKGCFKMWKELRSCVRSVEGCRRMVRRTER